MTRKKARMFFPAGKIDTSHHIFFAGIEDYKRMKKKVG